MPLPSPAPEADLAPTVAGGNHDPAPAGADPQTDRDARSDAPGGDSSPASDAAALLGLPAELGIGQLVPSADAVAPAASDSPDTALTGEAVADHGDSPGGVAPFVAGALVSLAVLGGGGGWLWWRNRDTHYWPA